MAFRSTTIFLCLAAAVLGAHASQLDLRSVGTHKGAAPADVSRAAEILQDLKRDVSVQPEPGQAMSMEAKVGFTFPLKYRAELLLSSQVNAAVANKDDHETLAVYEKVQRMFSRSYALRSMYPSFDAFWATLPGKPEVGVQDFAESWQKLGLPGVRASEVSSEYSSEVELGTAKEIDADGSGAISKDELKQYLYAWSIAAIEGCYRNMFSHADGACSDEVQTQYLQWAGLPFEWKQYDGAYQKLNGKWVNIETHAH